MQSRSPSSTLAPYAAAAISWEPPVERVPEPELMDEALQARAYAEADFAEPHDLCVSLLRERLPGFSGQSRAIDLGCGPADVTIRLARAFPKLVIDAVDGAEAMLAHGRERIARAGAGAEHRVALHRCLLGLDPLPGAGYDLVFSSSLLHHLADPTVLWSCVREAGAPAAHVFVMDLLRPDREEKIAELVMAHAPEAPGILQHDFACSLAAAYTPGEVEDQLAAAGLGGIRVEVVSDRHWIAWGQLGERLLGDAPRLRSSAEEQEP